jgi:hypothetical protein
MRRYRHCAQRGRSQRGVTLLSDAPLPGTSPGMKRSKRTVRGMEQWQRRSELPDLLGVTRLLLQAPPATATEEAFLDRYRDKEDYKKKKNNPEYFKQ